MSRRITSPSFPRKGESRGGAAGWRDLFHFQDLALHAELRKGLRRRDGFPPYAATLPPSPHMRQAPPHPPQRRPQGRCGTPTWPLMVRHSTPITQSTPKTAVLVGRRLGGSQLRRPHPLIGAAHQTSELAQDGLLSGFESRQVGLKGLNCELFGGPSQYEGRIVERYLVSRRVATTHTSPTQIAVRHAAQSKCASDGSRPIPD